MAVHVSLLLRVSSFKQLAPWRFHRPLAVSANRRNMRLQNAGCSIQDELFSSFEQLLSIADRKGISYDRWLHHEVYVGPLQMLFSLLTHTGSSLSFHAWACRGMCCIAGSRGLYLNCKHNLQICAGEFWGGWATESARQIQWSYLWGPPSHDPHPLGQHDHHCRFWHLYQGLLLQDGACCTSWSGRGRNFTTCGRPSGWADWVSLTIWHWLVLHG